MAESLRPQMNSPRSRKHKSKSLVMALGGSTLSKLKALEIQRKFPSDDLYLNKSLEAQCYSIERSLLNRRRSSPAQVISRLQEILSKSLDCVRDLTLMLDRPLDKTFSEYQLYLFRNHSTNLTSDGSPRFLKSPPGDELSPNVSRNFIREGHVCLSAGVTSLNRYMFLFGDLLIIAKPKSGATFKLKLRLPVSELWLHSAIDGVSESNVALNKSFVIGWPTISYVATFSTPEDKTLWWNVLKKTIDEQRTIDCGRTLPIHIQYRDPNQKNSAPLSLPVSNEDDVKSVVKLALDGLDMGASDADDFQLWVVSGKENAAYPLLGHEIPFCIKMNHMKQANINLDSPIVDRSEFIEDRSFLRSKCEFILKKKKSTASRLEVDSPNTQKRWRSPMKSPIINWALHKKPQKQNSFEQLSSPQGSFFGLPLAQFSPEVDQLPTPVEDMLLELFRRGPSTDGIFRKSALMKTVKQIRQELEDGKSVNFEDKSAIVVATIFKEFLRGLPSCAFGSEFLSELLETNDMTDGAERIAEIDKILNRLPILNQMLVKKFLCVLYHIARLSETNKMTSQNLAICIAPSFVWSSKAIVPACAKETTAACEFVQFMIDNFTEIFGEEATRILGDESEIQPPVTYDDDDDMPDRSQDIVDSQTGCKSPEEPRATNPDFTLSLHVPDYRVTDGLRQRSPETEGNSNTTPRVPNRRRFYDFRIPSRRHSENDLTDLNDNLPARKLLPKVPLSSYTTTAELIKHNVNGGEGGSEPSSSVIRIVSSTKETLPVDNGRRKNSPSNHAVYHRKVRPTPSYEEAVRKLRRNAQFSQKPDERLGSSDESIDQKYEEKLQDMPLEFNAKKISLDNDELVSPVGDRSPKCTESERQPLAYSILSPTPDRLKSCRYVSDELCRSPGNLSPNSGSSRQPKAPAYEQHLERRKRFEAAYLQKINLDLNDTSKRREQPNTTEYHSGGIDLALSYNGTECEKTSFAGGKGLGTSLDSAGIRALGLRSRASRHDSIPLSNGIHTFITQRRSPNLSGSSKGRTTKYDNCSSQSPASRSMPSSPLLMTSQSGEHDHKPTSPLRAAIDLGSFMYRPSDTSNGDFSSSIEGRQENGFVVSHVNGVCSLETENNNNEFKCDGTLHSQSLKLGDKIVEDLDELISSLKNRTDGSDSSSSTESVGNLDVPSHEDIQTILCQDESYV